MRVRRRFSGSTFALLISLSVLLAGGLNSGAATADGDRRDARTGHAQVGTFRAATGTRLLNHPHSGRAALTALGARSADAARVNGLAPARFEALLRNDPTASVGRDGRIYYADQLAPAATYASQQTSSLAAAPFPLDQTFGLHSRPAGQRNHTIYLDFDGYALPANSYWAAQVGMSPRTVAGWSLDGSAASFTDAEKEWIQEVWQIVAEKYAPFDVDVTTQDPGSDGYNRTDASDLTYGDHVVFTDDALALQEACAGACSGLATLGSFDEVNDGYGVGNPTGINNTEPAWIFSSTINDWASLAASAATHEVGHTLGLEHDGNATQEYYPGHANWFPLMGSGIRAVSQFSKGEYAGADNKQDDLAVIAAGGAPLLPDDHGTSTSTSITANADPLGSAESYAIDGVIGTRTDNDLFRIIRSCSGTLTATVIGVGAGQTVDLAIDLLGADGVVLAHNDPGSGQDAAVPPLPTGVDAAVSLAGAAAGTYYVRVDGVGHGTATSTGYSDYGSLGQYRLSVTGCAGTGGTVPAATPGFTATPEGRSTWGDLSWGSPAPADAATGWYLIGLPGIGVLNLAVPQFRSYATNGFAPGVDHTVGVAATNQYGIGATSSSVLHIPSWVQVGAPPVAVSTTRTSAAIGWTPSASNPGAALPDGWQVVLRHGSTVLFNDSAPADVIGVTFNPIPAGTYSLQVTQLLDSEEGTGFSATTTRSFTVPKAPAAPRIGKATGGAKRKPVNATARWAAPANTGGAPITGYRIKAYKLNAKNRVVRTITSTVRPAGARSFVMRLPAGRYKFKVLAYNRAGTSALSAYSKAVVAR